MRRTTKAEAKHYIELWKDETNYFNGRLTEREFETMLLYRMGFGQAEAITILSALIIAGAKFAQD